MSRAWYYGFAVGWFSAMIPMVILAGWVGR